jgi:flagellar motor protein MotB
MKLKFIILFLLIYTISWGQEKKIQFTCSFLDDSTGNYLKPQLFINRNNEKVSIGETSANSKIGLDLNVSEVLLELGHSNSHLIRIPINYHGKFEKQSYANYTFSVSKAKKAIIEKDLLIYCYPNDFQKNNEYQVSHFVNESLHCTKSLTKFINNKTGLVIPISDEISTQSSYQVSIIKENILLKSPSFFLKKGINLVDLNFYNNTSLMLKDSVQSRIVKKDNSSTIWVNQTIYFTQSEYSLKKEYFSTLDSITNYLKTNPNFTINVVGFTDNVGDKRLNSTLAEYRAKVVANYLINKGVSPKRIIINWQKSNSENNNIVESEKLSEFRKVIISQY